MTVQLPIFNERFVVERLINAACALDYPAEALFIQVLDDSTDVTTELARKRVDFHRAAGRNIRLLHRQERPGYKAGALACGFNEANTELIAIIDADFVPPANFLRRLVPHLAADTSLGMVQAAWRHINADTNWVTRGQAILLDTHFLVIQPARSMSGLLLNFNGSGGIWRRACIADAGGWHTDTLAEDLDLSYRAQVCGWSMLYLADEPIPGEVPPQIAALKRQQYRWARGGIQVLRKLGRRIWLAPLSLPKRVMGTLHLSSYMTGPLFMLFLLVCMPFAILYIGRLPLLPWLLPVGLGPPFLLLISQWAGYPDWKSRAVYLPITIFLGIGLALNNTRAVLAGVATRAPGAFIRTPKFGLRDAEDSWQGKANKLPVDWTLWAEAAMTLYTVILLVLAVQRMPAFVPVLSLCAISFGYVTVVDLWQSLGK